MSRGETSSLTSMSGGETSNLTSMSGGETSSLTSIYGGETSSLTSMSGGETSSLTSMSEGETSSLTSMYGASKSAIEFISKHVATLKSWPGQSFLDLCVRAKKFWERLSVVLMFSWSILFNLLSETDICILYTQYQLQPTLKVEIGLNCLFCSTEDGRQKKIEDVGVDFSYFFTLVNLNRKRHRKIRGFTVCFCPKNLIIWKWKWIDTR